MLFKIKSQLLFPLLYSWFIIKNVL